MDFELTNVRDNPFTHQRIRIDKTLNTFPQIGIANLESTYDSYDAVVFKRARDMTFGMIAERQIDCRHQRRFTQNTTFIADTLEVRLPREIEIDCGFIQYVNISVVQMHASLSKTSEVQAMTETQDDCLDALNQIYAKTHLSKKLQSYSLMEQLIQESTVFLKDKKAKFRILGSDGYGFAINYRAEKADGSELLTYVLAYKLKRGRYRATVT